MLVCSVAYCVLEMVSIVEHIKNPKKLCKTNRIQSGDLLSSNSKSLALVHVELQSDLKSSIENKPVFFTFLEYLPSYLFTSLLLFVSTLLVRDLHNMLFVHLIAGVRKTPVYWSR